MSRVLLPDGELSLTDGTGARGDQDVRLTGTELEVVRVLHAASPEVVDTEALRERAWGRAVSAGVVAVTIRRIREKLEPVPSRPAVLITRRGIGYLWRAVAPEASNPMHWMGMAPGPWPVEVLEAVTGTARAGWESELESAGVTRSEAGWVSSGGATDPAPLVAWLAEQPLEPVSLRPLRALLEQCVDRAVAPDRLVHRLARLYTAYGGDALGLTETHLVGRLDPIAQCIRLEVHTLCDAVMVDPAPALAALEQAEPSSAVGAAWVMHGAAVQAEQSDDPVQQKARFLALVQRGLEILEPYDDVSACDARILGGALLTLGGDRETLRAMLDRVDAHAPILTLPTLHLEALFRRVQFRLCSATSRGHELLRTTLSRFPHPDSAHWASAASWFGMVLLRQREEEEGLYWLERSLPLLDSRVPAVASQMRTRAALTMLHRPSTALALLPDALFLESHTTRAVGRWVRAVLGDDSVVLSDDLLALQAAFERREGAESAEWPWIARALERYAVQKA